MRSVAEATADALRTLDRFNSTEREKALAVQGEGDHRRGAPPTLPTSRDDRGDR